MTITCFHLYFLLTRLHYTPFQLITNTQVAKRCFLVANGYFLILAVYDRKMTFYDLEKAFKNFSATINH